MVLVSHPEAAYSIQVSRHISDFQYCSHHEITTQLLGPFNAMLHAYSQLWHSSPV